MKVPPNASLLQSLAAFGDAQRPAPLSPDARQAPVKRAAAAEQSAAASAPARPAAAKAVQREAPIAKPTARLQPLGQFVDIRV